MAIKASSTFYARAGLLYGNDLVALSPIYSYNSNSLTPEQVAWNPVYGYTTSTFGEVNKCTWSVDPQNWVNCITNGVTNILQWILFPHDFSLSMFRSAFDGFKTVF